MKKLLSMFAVLLFLGCNTICPCEGPMYELQTRADLLQRTVDGMYADMLNLAKQHDADTALRFSTPQNCGELEDRD